MMTKKSLILSYLCLFFFLVSCAAAVLASDKNRLEVQIKNELPAGQDGDPDDDVIIDPFPSWLGVFCRFSYVDDLGVSRLLHVHKELVLMSYNSTTSESINCRCSWGRLCKDLVVSGTGTPCAQPRPGPSGAVCKWEVRLDGFYFLTATTGWKKMHSWH